MCRKSFDCRAGLFFETGTMQDVFQRKKTELLKRHMLKIMLRMLVSRSARNLEIKGFTLSGQAALRGRTLLRSQCTSSSLISTPLSYFRPLRCSYSLSFLCKITVVQTTMEYILHPLRTSFAILDSASLSTAPGTKWCEEWWNRSDKAATWLRK